MKGTIIVFAATVLASVAVMAQDVKMRTVGKVGMMVSYRLDQLCDYPNDSREDAWREEGTLMLEIGEGRAHNYVIEERKQVIRMLEKFKSKNHWWLEPNIHACVGETLIDHGELTMIVNLDAAGIYHYKEAVPEMRWKIDSSHKRILDYDCQRATCSFRGRDYEAWFAVDVPVSFGPWKLGGLPGLILEACDSKDEYHFTATGIEKSDGEMQLLDEDIRPIKREKALKMEALVHKDHGAYASDYGLTFTMEGLEHVAMPYHPLELK